MKHADREKEKGRPCTPLWYIKQGSWGRLDESTSIDGPETTENSEQGTLTTAIGACDQHVHARADLEG